jgi:hypothetical protein
VAEDDVHHAKLGLDKINDRMIEARRDLIRDGGRRAIQVIDESDLNTSAGAQIAQHVEEALCSI